MSIYDELRSIAVRTDNQIVDNQSLQTEGGNERVTFVRQSPRIEPPSGSQPFDEFGSIAIPAVGAGSFDVVSFTMPLGWSGFVFYGSCNFTGGGFVQGSGDIVWRLFLDNTVVRNYSNVTVEKGSIQQARLIAGGIPVVSGQVIKWQVTHVANAALNGNIVCSLQGWMYSQQRENY